MSTAALLACAPSPRAGSPDKCADYNGGPFAGLSGTLHGERDRARRIASRLIARDELGRDHSESGGRTVRLVPICENHRLSENKLKKGRFVAMLTGPGTRPRFSPMENDTVFWWIYGEEMETAAGGDTTVWHSEFLSIKGDVAAPYLVAAHLHICDGERPSPADQEAVTWHEGTCHRATVAAAMRLTGDKPWFGCTRGCCYAAMPTLRVDLDSLPADSLAPDTTRDTTRSPSGA